MKIKYSFFFFLICGLIACKKDTREPASINMRTILVYLGGDNNLYQETDEKIAALRKAYVSGMGRLVIYQDATGMTPRLLEISADAKGTGILRTLRTYQEVHSYPANVFKQILADVQQLAPAPSYGLVLFSHASGWLPQQTLIRPYAVAQDKDEDLELRDFAAAIPDHFFDFMIFEACFMSGIEVMYELKDKTDFIVASCAEILSPGFTPVYPKLLPLLYEPKADLEQFAGTYFNYCNGLPGNYRSATISVVQTSALPKLADWIRQNTRLTSIPADDLKQIQHFDRYASYSLFYDFEDYFHRISPGKSNAGLSILLNQVLTFKAATKDFMPGYSGFEIKHFSGLTCYVPQEGFSFLNQEYKKLKWTKAVFH